MTCEEKFIEIYQKEPDISFCPYRICPLGAHIDHQLGSILGFALDRGVYLAYKINYDGIIDIQSMNFKKKIYFNIDAVPRMKEGNWGDYLKGATKVLGQRYKLRNGLVGVIKGTLPSGGVSSSAAVIICFMKALCMVNDINLTDSEYIFFAKIAENEYVGVNSGKLDQSCEILCRENSILYVDCKDNHYQNFPMNPKMSPFKIGIFFSGLERNLATSAYNNRVDECKASAFALYSYSLIDNQSFICNMADGERFSDMYLRNIPEELFRKFGYKLPIPWQKRCRHFYSECERVEKGVDFWKSGDIENFGRLINESGLSSIVNYECGSPWLIKLYDILSNLEGVYGARFSGAGFKGSCMAIINPEYEDRIKNVVELEYIKGFPYLAGKYKAFICSTSDGVGNAKGEKF